MSNEIDPIVDNWYQHIDKGQRFYVVAVNDDDGTIEIQYFDGTVEEIDKGAWPLLDIEPAEEPENWSGPLDVADPEDLGADVTDTTANDWEEPLQEIKPDALKTEDDWGEGAPKEEPEDVLPEDLID